MSLRFFDKQGRVYDHKTESWDAELNDALVDRKIGAIDVPNETQRFGIGLALLCLNVVKTGTATGSSALS